MTNLQEVIVWGPIGSVVPGLYDPEAGTVQLYKLDEYGLFGFRKPEKVNPEDLAPFRDLFPFGDSETFSGPEKRRLRAFAHRDEPQPDIPAWFHGKPVVVAASVATCRQVRKFGRRWCRFYYGPTDFSRRPAGGYAWQIFPLDVPGDWGASKVEEYLAGTGGVPNAYR